MSREDLERLIDELVEVGHALAESMWDPRARDKRGRLQAYWDRLVDGWERGRP